MKLQKVSNIFHISDIHIKLYKGRKQYQKLLQELLKTIQERKDQNSIAVITGDIFHSKTDMSPQSVKMGINYLSSISNLLPTIVIAGNHDANLANSHRLDSLSPIVDVIESKHELIYLKETGWHKYKNINFWLASIYDQRLPKKKSEFPKEGVNIALYHGIVGSIRANGILLKPKFEVEQFKYFDYVLLGDIHKRQFLSSQKPIIAYAGSLPQLNFGQQVQNHGMLIWNLQDGMVQQVDIKNDYSFFNVQIENGQIIKMPDIKASNPRIKLKYSNTTLNRLRQIQQQLKKQYTIQQMMVVRVPSKLEIKSSTFEYNLDNISNIGYQQQIIKEYVSHVDIKIEPQQLKKVLDLNEEINDLVKNSKTKGQHQQNVWSIQKLQFDNFFNFSQNNAIDFTQKRGIIGILGQNRSGKSSLIDIIIFMLYDRTSRTNKTISILNNKKSRLYGKISLLINGVRYYIEKEGELNKKGDSLPIKIKFWMEDPDTQQVVDLTGTQRISTNSIIQQYIGTFQDAKATFISTQGDSNIFLQLTNTDRKTQLNSLLNLTLFDDFYNYVNDKARDVKSKLQQIDITTIEQQIETKRKRNIQIKAILNRNNEYKYVLVETDKHLNQKLKLTLASLGSQEYKGRDYLQIFNDISLYSKMKSGAQKRLIECNNKYQQTVNAIKQLEEIKQSVNVQVLKAAYSKDKQTINIYNNNLNEIKVLEASKREYQKKHKLLKQVQYDQNCPYCMNNPLTKDAMQAQSQLKIINQKIKNLEDENQNLKNIVDEVIELEQTINYYEKEIVPYLESFHKVQAQNKASIAAAQRQIQQHQSKLTLLQKQKEQFLKNEQTIKQNIKTRQIVSSLEKEIQSNQKQLKELQKQDLSLNIQLAAGNQIVKNNVSLRDRYNKFDADLIIAQKYKLIMGREGIQYYITSNIVQILESTMNEVLEMLTNFSVQFVLDGRTIDINIVYADKMYPVETCSGFQKFVISIALRNALSTITNKSKGKMFIIDEGFGVLDAENVTAFNRIIEYISQKYQTLLIVSHLDAMKSMIQQQINIEIIDGVSAIR